MLDRAIGEKRPTLNEVTALVVHQGISLFADTTLGVKVLELTARAMERPKFPAEVNRATRATLASQTAAEEQQQAETVADCMAIILNGEQYYPILRRDNQVIARQKFNLMNLIRTIRGMTTDKLREEIVLDLIRKDRDSGALVEGSEVPCLLEKFLGEDNPTPSPQVNSALALVRDTFNHMVERAVAEGYTDSATSQTA